MLVDLTSAKQSARWKLPAIVIAIGTVLAGGVYNQVQAKNRAVGPDGCFLHRPAQALEMFGVDHSDLLVPANRQRVHEALRRAIAGLPEGGRLVIVALGSDPAAEPVAYFNRCAPPRPEEVNGITRGGTGFAEARQTFEDDARKALDEVGRLPAADTSPIAERIEILVAFRPFIEGGVGPVTGPKAFRLVGDGLQNTERNSFYRRGRPLPTARPGVLDGWTFEFVQTTNARDAALQTEEMRYAWRQWAADGHALDFSVDAAGVPPSRG